jgi:hypothetical protein
VGLVTWLKLEKKAAKERPGHRGVIPEKNRALATNHDGLPANRLTAIGRFLADRHRFSWRAHETGATAVQPRSTVA